MTKQCASLVVGTVNLVLRIASGGAPDAHSEELSAQQIRALMLIKHQQGALVSQVLQQIGPTVRAAERIVDGLVERGLVRPDEFRDGRRRSALSLADEGEQTVASIHVQALSCLTDRLATLSPDECEQVRMALGLLRKALMPEGVVAR